VLLKISGLRTLNTQSAIQKVEIMRSGDVRFSTLSSFSCALIFKRSLQLVRGTPFLEPAQSLGYLLKLLTKHASFFVNCRRMFLCYLFTRS